MALAVPLRTAVCVTGRFPALAGVDLAVAQGEVVVLEGPNGAGKTSVLRLCAGLLPLAGGEGTVLGCALRTDGAALDAVLDRLGLGGRVRRTPVGRLSAGQRRRVALAQLVARRPDLWLLDEPHAGLDADARTVLGGGIAEG